MKQSMKLILTGLTVLMTSLMLQAQELAQVQEQVKEQEQVCAKYEAQVKGSIDHVEISRRAENLICKIYLKFDLSKGDQFNMISQCPLMIEDAIKYPIVDFGCSYEDYKPGQPFSGVIFMYPQGQEIIPD